MTNISVTDHSERIDRGCYLFLIFLTGCLIGWLYEEVFYWITEGMLRNRGILYGPWLPIYGIGALCIYMMKPAKKNPVLLFFLCCTLTSFVEYIIGYVGIRLSDKCSVSHANYILNANLIGNRRTLVTSVVRVRRFFFLKIYTVFPHMRPLNIACMLSRMQWQEG